MDFCEPGCRKHGTKACTGTCTYIDGILDGYEPRLDGYVERDEVDRLLEWYADEYAEIADYLRMLKEELMQIKPSNVGPLIHASWKHVTWVKDEREQEGGYWISRCSHCIMPYHSETPFCPHCGAKMDGAT